MSDNISELNSTFHAFGQNDMKSTLLLDLNNMLTFDVLLQLLFALIVFILTKIPFDAGSFSKVFGAVQP
jgi:hypothetical protein